MTKGAFSRVILFFLLFEWLLSLILRGNTARSRQDTSCSNWPFQQQKRSRDDFCRKHLERQYYTEEGQEALNLTFERQIRYVVCIFHVSFAILLR